MGNGGGGTRAFGRRRGGKKRNFHYTENYGGSEGGTNLSGMRKSPPGSLYRVSKFSEKGLKDKAELRLGGAEAWWEVRSSRRKY